MPTGSTDQIHVLYVDDEPEFADLTATFLERETDRFEVETATSADEGLERMADRPPDCVVSDYDMPGTDGIEFLETVRDRYPELPFVLYTDNGSEAVAGEAISAGVTDYIRKESGTDHDVLLADRIENAVTDYWSRQTAERQKQRLELFFQESPLGAIQWDDEFRFEQVNERAEEILGYDEAELRGEFWETIVAGENREQVGDSAEKLLSADGGTEVTVKNVRKDGEIRTCEWHTRTVTDADGNVQKIFSEFQDVTERERHKTALEEYETIIEALTDAVYVLDEEGRFSYVSDELVELVGYDRETVLGSAPSLIKDEAAVERAERELGRLLSSDGPETVTFEVTLQPRDGDPIVCEDQMGVLPYDGDEFDGSVGTLRDITDRKERKQELQTIKRQYQTLVENFPDGAVFLFDSDLRYVRAGGTELSEVGVSGDEVEGATPHDLFPEELADETARYYRETLAGNSHTYEQEYRDERYRIQTVPVRTDGEVAYGLAVSQKVTEQVEHRRALERQNERLDEFASVVSHDLRNPLNTADLGLELAQSDCESAHLEDARKGVQRSLDLIEDLLSLAREGEQGIEARPVGLEDAVRNAWASLDTAEATLSLETDLVIRADRDRLRQLLINLIENAVDHGGADVAIAVGEMDDGFYLEDDGSGIPERERETVFEAGHTTSEEGTGIGLRIVRQVADSHGWTVTVTDGTDDGARFEIAGVETAD